MVATGYSDTQDPKVDWTDEVRALLKQHATIIQTVRQIEQYRRQLVTMDQIEWLGTQQEEVAQSLRQLLDEQSTLDETVREKLRSLAQRQAELAGSARAFASTRQALEPLLSEQSQAVQRSEVVAEELRQELVGADLDRLERAVQQVLAQSQLDEAALSELFDLSRPD